MQKRIHTLCFLLIGAAVFAQVKIEEPLFKILKPTESKIIFSGHSSRQIIEGGGVALGDINNDGLLDVFFTADSVIALYLNKGNMVFEDITDKAGIKQNLSSTGVTMGDINNDGFLDILICRESMFGKKNVKKGPNKDSLNVKKNRQKEFALALNDTSNFEYNQRPANGSMLDTANVCLYINNGNLTFSERAKEYGIKTDKLLRQAIFLDIDKDNLLDIYMDGSYVYKRSTYSIQGLNAETRGEKFQPAYLFKNINGKKFENIIGKSNIQFDSKAHFVLNVFASDLDQDGWTDIYANSDFESPDYFFRNNHDGTFTEMASKMFRHTSYYTMGVDIADVNNDGLLDLYSTDMRPATNSGQKTTKFESTFEKELLIGVSPDDIVRQQVKNCLQLNMGSGKFNEISEMAGVDATEWSWAALIADFDNDGNKDIFVANGLTNQMSLMFDMPHVADSFRRANVNVPIEKRSEYMRNIMMNDKKPKRQYVNFIFKNNGDLSFTDKKEKWGMGPPVNSDGAAYGDLDNDGDLDIVINNKGSVSFIYENQSVQQKGGNYLRLKLKNTDNHPIESSTATIYYQNKMQFLELQPTRGFYSCSENMLHFGLGDISTIDSLLIKWPDGKMEKKTNLKVNQLITVYNKDANIIRGPKEIFEPPFIEEKNTGIDFKHKENEYYDFRKDPLICNFYSKGGPGLAVGDINNDGKDDVYVGGAMGYARGFFIQKDMGAFIRKENEITLDTSYEDQGALIFDANNDGLNDVFVVSGGNEVEASDKKYMHRLYTAKKDGSFSKKGISGIKSSGSCVIAADYDNDGDLDLFVGGRITAQNYPVIPNSYILENTKGSFKDVTNIIAPALSKIGMVTSAIFTDYNNDDKLDLIVVGEWMPVTFFKNSGGKFILDNPNLIFNIKSDGLWNSITAGDFDNDGDMDYVAGNLGLNTRYEANQDYPLNLFYGDVDDNGSVDIITTYYENGSQYPCKQLTQLSARINGMSKKFYKAKMFEKAEIRDILDSAAYSRAKKLWAYTSATCYIENKGNGKFEFKELPKIAQTSPVNGVVVKDVNEDGNLDIVLVGNFYYPEIERGKYDAGKGLYLIGDGSNNFVPQSIESSGFLVERDARGLVLLSSPKENKTLVIATQNSDLTKVFSFAKASQNNIVRVKPYDKYALVKLSNGKTRKEEFYYGSGYLSQSSRVLFFPASATYKIH